MIPHIDESDFMKLKESGVIAAGMIPKIHNALESAKSGVKEVRICKSESLLSDSGTIITK